MLLTEMYLKGVSINSLSKSFSLPKVLHRSQLVTESKNISFKELLEPFKEEEIYRDEEHGFVVKKVYTKLNPDGLDMAYNLDGAFIGFPKEAEFLCVNRGLRVEALDGSSVCSIGFSPTENGWVGWSHRAISPVFKIGSKIDSENHLCCGGEPDFQVGFEAKTLDDCKRLAIAYARAVD